MSAQALGRQWFRARLGKPQVQMLLEVRHCALCRGACSGYLASFIVQLRDVDGLFSIGGTNLRSSFAHVTDKLPMSLACYVPPQSNSSKGAAGS